MGDPFLLEEALKSLIAVSVAGGAGGVWARASSWRKDKQAQASYKKALGAAIAQYSGSDPSRSGSDPSRLELAAPLLDQRFLADTRVSQELRKFFTNDEPDAEALAGLWRDALPPALTSRDLLVEAELFLKHPRSELQKSPHFRDSLTTSSVLGIAEPLRSIEEELGEIQEQLDGIAALLDSAFRRLAHTFSRSQPDVRRHILAYTGYIEEKTRGFVGRQFFLDEFDRFMAQESRGYFFVRGDPGIGKTALAAEMVKVRGYVHHFNVWTEGIRRADRFLTNVCAQLISVYGLSCQVPSPEEGRDAGPLTKVLEEVAGRLGPARKTVIVVDALDEAETKRGVNPLYLPRNLPEGVYIVVTARIEDTSLPLSIGCEYRDLVIGHDDEANLVDIRAFLAKAVERTGIRAYIKRNRKNEGCFVRHLTKKSDGNFMYLRYVLPEIERGAYKDLELEGLPFGLWKYYEDHWRRMQDQDEDAWFKYRLPVIAALTLTARPISVEVITEFTGLRPAESPRVARVLMEWRQFLHEQQVEFNGTPIRCYRLYHASFHKFLSEVKEVSQQRRAWEDAEARMDEALDNWLAHSRFADG